MKDIVFIVTVAVTLVVFIVGGMFLVFRRYHKKLVERINTLTDYLEKINIGGRELLFDTSEDEFSHLQDEIYKTVTTLYQTRDAAVAAKKNYADNLANIAHQLKTPITAISLLGQMMREQLSAEKEKSERAAQGQAHSAHQGQTGQAQKMSAYPEQIDRQLKRLTYLEEALLLLSRIDAGTLTLARNTVDVFTLLTLAADNLQELFAQAEVSVEIPEKGGVCITADMDWTMEAIMNLMKNCIEHTEKGTAVHCFYEKNPLYVQIQIWDEGAGFAKEDLPHIFERFYRGKDAGNTGIGIGLSLSKAMIEMQNGVISAFNRPDNGACFEIRFYGH